LKLTSAFCFLEAENQSQSIAACAARFQWC